MLTEARACVDVQLVKLAAQHVGDEIVAAVASGKVDPAACKPLGSPGVVRPGTTHLATLLTHWPDVLATLGGRC